MFTYKGSLIFVLVVWIKSMLLLTEKFMISVLYPHCWSAAGLGPGLFTYNTTTNSSLDAPATIIIIKLCKTC